MARSGRSVTGPHRSRTVRSRARPHGRSGLPQPGHASARRARATRAAAVSKTSIIVHPASLRGSRTPGKRQLVLHPGPRLAARATRPARPQPPAPHRHATAAAEPCGPPGPADPRGPARHRQGAAADQPASPAPLIGTVNAGNRQNRGNPSRRSTALAGTELTDAAGQPLRYTPHDFRRMFITDAIMNGLPPHIAQIVAGHQDINVTLGYKAVYPDEAIQAHLAFLARRRALRPSEEYRVPTDAEWAEFLGHFERRKVATGTCGRAFSTPCIHEHSCLRCSMHWPDPAQRPRIAEIRDNLTARITEAEREGWLGEVEGLKVSLAGAEDKLAQIDRRTHAAPVDLGLPAALQPA